MRLEWERSLHTIERVDPVAPESHCGLLKNPPSGHTQSYHASFKRIAPSLSDVDMAAENAVSRFCVEYLLSSFQHICSDDRALEKPNNTWPLLGYASIM